MYRLKFGQGSDAFYLIAAVLKTHFYLYAFKQITFCTAVQVFSAPVQKNKTKIRSKIK